MQPIKKEYINNMIMRNIILGLTLMLMAVSCTEKPHDIVLKFNVTDPTVKEITLTCHTDILTFPLDSTGHAEAVIDDVDAAYARIWYGRNTHQIYMERGDRATIAFDAADFTGTFTFEGEKKNAVEYLNTITYTGLPDESYALEFERYLEKHNAKCEDAVKILKAHDLKDCGDFLKMEEARIRYSYANPILMYPVGHALMTASQNYNPDEMWYAVVDSYFVEDEDYVDIDEYRNFIIEAAHALDKANCDEKNLRLKTAAQMQYITDRFSNPKVVSVLLHYLAASYVDTYGIDQIEEICTIYKTYVKNEAMIADFQAKYDKWDISKPGRQSPDFDAVDIDGKKWSLADLKGKYVYIDMWATWCNPCRKELPYLRALEERFKDANITFVGLSTDGDKAKWEEMVRSGAMCGVQLYLGPRSKFQKAYNINGIPRFILLDKSGVIISNDMSRPSSDETASFIENLEGIR